MTTTTRRATTRDRYHTVSAIGAKRELTPEGFLICRDVPLARIGEQLYGPDETPVPVGRDGVARIMREPEEVFRPETIASAIGKPFVVQHPQEMAVTPDTWRSYVAGNILSARRGEGADADVILGDILVGDADAIRLIDAGMREVSMGYDCGYEAIGDDGSGVGRQYDIVFNHVALVDAGRCGPRCAIGDQATNIITKQEAHMTRGRFASFVDRAFGAKDDKDKEAIRREAMTVDEAAEREEKEKREAEDRARAGDAIKQINDLRASMDAQFAKFTDALAKLAKARDAEESAEEKEKREKKEAEDKARDEKINGQLEMEAPPGTGDQIRRANDSALLEDSFADTVAAAEILAPGIRLPTFDAKAPPARTFDQICGLRRKAIDVTMLTPDGRAMVDQLTAGRGIDTKAATCDAVRSLFHSLTVLKKQANNGAMTAGATARGRSTGGDQAQPRTLGELAKANRDFWTKRTGTAA